MFRRFLDLWLPRLLFLLSLGTALALTSAVLFSPAFQGSDSALLLVLFAQDGTVRRIALICAGGLAVTAFLFFRPQPSDINRKTRQPPRTMAGA